MWFFEEAIALAILVKNIQCNYVQVVVDVNNLKNGRKPVKLHKESPARCAGEGNLLVNDFDEKNVRCVPEDFKKKKFLRKIGNFLSKYFF